MTTVREGLEAFVLSMRGVKSNETIKWYMKYLQPLVTFIGEDKAVSDVTIGDLRRWRAQLEERDSKFGQVRPRVNGKLSPYTIHGYVRGVKIWCRWLVAEGLLQQDPSERLELPKLPRAPCKGIAEPDMRAIVAATDTARDRALVMFLADTLARVGGVCHLRISDLDLAADRALVHEKGAEGREVFFSSATSAALLAWLNVRPAVDHDFVFISEHPRHHGRPLTTSGVFHLLERLAQRAGVTGKFGPHQWRHAGARNLIQNGAPLSVVAQILGHADIGVTWRFYAQLGGPQLQEAHARYGYLWG